MTYQQIANMVQELGIPVTYYQFPNDKAPSLPYLVYYYPNRDDMSADNTNYVKIESLVIELYTEEKDLELEQNLENILKNHNITYNKTDNFIDKESMYEIYYESEVLINEQ